MATREANQAYYLAHKDRICTRMRNRARDNREEATEKAGGRCVKCGGTDRLQFDHIDPKTKVCHKIWTWSPERRAAELAKCQLLCESCHIQKTIENDEHQWRSKAWE